MWIIHEIPLSQLTFICSKSTKEKLEKVWNMFKVNNKETGTKPMDVVVVFLLLTLNIFHTFF